MERVPREMAGREQLWLVGLSNYVRMHEYLLRGSANAGLEREQRQIEQW